MQADLRGGVSGWTSCARVLLSGDHPLIRTALGLMISADGMVVAGECSNQPDPLRRALRAGVDVIVMDLDLDSSWWTRMERLEVLLAAAGHCPVLIVTRSDDPHDIATALQKGAVGVVLKSGPAEVLMHAVRVILAGGAWVERSTVASVFRPAQMRDHAIVAQKLTRREVQVVELVRMALQNKKIAERLAITETTVRHHLTSIFDKLSLTNRMELMRYASDDARPLGS